MVIQELYERWQALLSNPEKKIGRSSQSFELTVPITTEFCRNGDYDKAISLIFRIMEDDTACYYDALVYMYKAILCAGDFSFAYEVIVMAELIVKRVLGFCPPGRGITAEEPVWTQTALRRELEALLMRNSDFCSENDLIKTIKPYSCQGDYKLPGGMGIHTQKGIHDAVKTMDTWRKEYKSYLD